MPHLKGNSLKDNLFAVRYFISGQGLSLTIFKATRSDNRGPKTKHIDYLTTITHEPNVSIPKLVKYLSKRARQPEWTVVFKSLIVIHHLLNRGNQRFIQNMATSGGRDQFFARINSFDDTTSKLALDMSTYLRRYARYLDSRIKTYRVLGLDFCRLKSDNSLLPKRMKNISYEELMLTVPNLQAQFDMILKFDITTPELENGIIDQAFLMLFGDLVKLYIAYQSCIIRVIELFFSSRILSQARDLFQIYSLFLIRMDMVRDFMQVVESTGIKIDDFPKVTRVPNIDIKIFKEYLEHLESTKPRRDSIPIAVIKATSESRIRTNLSSTLGHRPKRPSSMGETEGNEKLLKISNSIFGRRSNRGIRKLEEPLREINPTNNIDSSPNKPNDDSSKKAKLAGSKRYEINQDLADLIIKPLNDDLIGNSLEGANGTPSKEDDSQNKDIDLMVIDSESSTSSSPLGDKSMIDLRDDYMPLDEKELMNEVFPPEPQDIIVDKDMDKSPAGSSRASPPYQKLEELAT